MQPALLRALALFVPLLLLVASWELRRPAARERAGLTLALLWNALVLLPLNALAQELGWWQFEVAGGTLAGVPLDLLLGWTLLWGGVAPLALRGRAPALTLAAMLALDLCLMPLFAPIVVLGDTWLLGELAALACAALPGLLLVEWTKRDVQLSRRAALQGLGFGLALVYLLPTALLQYEGRAWSELARALASHAGLGWQVLALAAIPGVAAIQELLRSGQGTPVPFDPTRRLVTSGPYAFVRNPMQISALLLLLVLAAAAQSRLLAGGALVCVAYCAGYASWQEHAALEQRFGDPWREYRRALRAWLPRWQPLTPSAPAQLYVARGCAPCSQLGRWLQARDLVGVELRAAEEHPRGMPERLRYESAGGAAPLEGVRAFAMALQHAHLGLALCGMLLGAPLISALAQRTLDALGFGPQRSWASAEEA